MLQTAESMGVQMPSLRAIALALDCNPQRIYNVAKKPIPGVTYDPHQYNWDAITSFIERRLSDELGVPTKEALIQKAAEIDATLAAKDRRSGGNGAVRKQIDVGGGHMIPERRVEVNVGDTVVLKKDNRVFEAVYLNEASVVLQATCPPSLVLTTISNWTLNQKLIADETTKAAEIERRKALYEEATAGEAEAEG
jgi:hypothetical protein